MFMLFFMLKNRGNKNGFQWDAYHPLDDRIPACTGQGVYSSNHWVGGIYLGGELSAQGGVCPRGGVCPGVCVCPGGCLPGVCDIHPPGSEADTPPVNRMTDRCKNITL